MAKYKAGQKIEIKLTKEMAKQLNTLEEVNFTPKDFKIAGLVFESEEYDKLKKLTGNREINDKNVLQKMSLIEKNGFKTTDPIILDTEGKIIDGQHRREAAIELKVPFKFTVDTESKNSLETTIEMNNSSKAWNLDDYVNAYALNGNDNYRKLLALKNELDVNLTKTLVLYAGYMVGNETQAAIKNGNFEYNEIKATRAKLFLNEIKQLQDVILNTHYKKMLNSQTFMSAYVKLRRKENFKFNILKSQFEKLRYSNLNPRNMQESLVESYNMQRKTNRISLED